MFSEETQYINLFFNTDNWRKLCDVQNKLNIGTGGIIRLLLGSCLFSQGSIVFELANLAELFISNKQAYQYNLVLTKSLTDFLSESENNTLKINREVIIRAAHCYFSNDLGTLPKPIPEEQYRIDNTSIGWSRITVNGNMAMKHYFMQEKKLSGKTIGIVISHVINSFLKDLQEKDK
jgi:hypothetical protein